jgi:hypothetical protein
VDVVQDLRPFRDDVDEDRIRQDQDHEGFEVLDSKDVRETLHHGDADAQRGEDDEEPVAEEPGGEHAEFPVLGPEGGRFHGRSSSAEQRGGSPAPCGTDSFSVSVQKSAAVGLG